jgi:ABC-type amino acid transport substrate-binding protein
VLEERNWGSLTTNGSWDGLIGMLTSHDVDIATTNLIVNSERVDAVDFLAPIADIK